MTLINSVFLLLAIAYIGVILLYSYHWRRLPYWKPPSRVPNTTVTVIIAARNELNNIGDCLKAIKEQDFPKSQVQVLVVDDHSTDNTDEVINNFTDETIKLLHLPESAQGKKAAIAYAMQFAKGTLVVTTDADCTMHKDWLSLLTLFYEETKARFIAAPVSFYGEHSLFTGFQTLDFMGMMGVTGAGISGGFMRTCNGANLAYERSLFEELNGFDGINHIASGDDILLMQKAAKQAPEALAFIKNPAATTFTLAPSTIKDFVRQRVRWGTKSSGYTEWPIRLILAIVWGNSMAIFITALAYLFTANPLWAASLGLQHFFKGIADFFYLRMMTRFFGRPELLRFFLPGLFLHCWYIAYVGTLSIFKKEYVWKDRKVR